MKAFWADPVRAAHLRAAMRRVSPAAEQAILADVLARPNTPLKVLAFEHDVSESTVGQIARSHNVRRKPRSISSDGAPMEHPLWPEDAVA